jgi:site-specific recombinase XerC
MLAEYGAWVTRQRLSARTRQTYIASVRAFAGWLGQRDGGVGDALSVPGGRDVAVGDYTRYLTLERGLAPASVNQALAGLNHFFRFLGLGAASVGRERRPRAVPRALDAEQQRELLRSAARSSARDRAIVGIFLFAGLRLSEAAALQIAEVHIGARAGHVVVRSGSAGTHREVDLNDLLRAMLDEWVKDRAKIAPTGETSFFLTRSGRPLSPRSIDLAVRRVATRADLSLSARVLRHTFVIRLTRATNDPRLVDEHGEPPTDTPRRQES